MCSENWPDNVEPLSPLFSEQCGQWLYNATLDSLSLSFSIRTVHDGKP